jgi:hypothetical protein
MNGGCGTPKRSGPTSTTRSCHQQGSCIFFPNKSSATAAAAAVSIANSIGSPLAHNNNQRIAHV